jgi:glycerol-1-phosphate dehydrogenase [NAD(P)+]
MQSTTDDHLICQHVNASLWDSATTRRVVIGTDALEAVPNCFRSSFANTPAIVVADENTYDAAGRRVAHLFAAAKQDAHEPYVFHEANLHADYFYVSQLREHLSRNNAIPLAVGSGTINDLVKLASYECERPYMSVGTAASMDGYTSIGAAVMRGGFKQSRPCPAPVAVLIDLNVVFAAPSRLHAAGHADLLAKVPAGADWLVADALGVESIVAQAWALVQSRLRNCIGDPAAIRRGDRHALAGLVEGLIMSGLGMQYTGTSRPASGAKHQFSHLWDMQSHMFRGAAPMHGEQVGIGSIAVAAVYERFLRYTAEDIDLDMDAISRRWPSWSAVEAETRRCFPDPHLAERIVEQQRAKYVGVEQLVARLARLKDCWGELQEKLRDQLLTAEQTRSMLTAVGAPSQPEDIGISHERLHESHRLARQIRSRYTILDLVFQAGWWDDCVTGLFGSGGFWR